MQRAAWLSVLCALAALAACKSVFSGGDLPPPPAEVRILESSVVIKQGGIGVKDKQDATYVLVDAENGTAEDRAVSLEGTLLDAAGNELTRLYLEEIRMPAHEKRTFALVAAGTVPQATKAKLRVRAAPVAKDPPVAIVRELKQDRGETGLVATATLENKIEKQALATVIVAFYDADGKLLARQFRPVQLNPRATDSFTFTGPVAATKAAAFVGDVAY